jgi:hypothetical protein
VTSPNDHQSPIGTINLHSKQGQAIRLDFPDSLFFSDDIKCTTYLTVMICLSELFCAI